jgi:hypothetical protein
MGTLENLSALVEALRGSRERLEALANRAAGVSRRLRADAPTILSLDKLAHERRAPGAQPRGERWEGEEGAQSGGWEISLISEEGK